MKVFKQVEIDVCATCGKERTYWGAGKAKNCTTCGVELCGHCGEIVEAGVDYGRRLKLQGWFCSKCSQNMQRQIEALGFKSVEVSRDQVLISDPAE